MSKSEKLFEIVAFAVSALALALFFAAICALIVLDPPEVSHPWLREGL